MLIILSAYIAKPMKLVRSPQVEYLHITAKRPKSEAKREKTSQRSLLIILIFLAIHFYMDYPDLS